MQMNIEALFPNFHDEVFGVSYTLKSVLEGISGEGVTVGATVFGKGAEVSKPYVHSLMPRQLCQFVVPCLNDPMNWIFRSARRRVRTGDVAYFWLGSPAKMCEYFRARRIMVVREMINCTLQLRRQELKKAYASLREPDRSGITDEMIARERSDLLAVDAVFCPNPFVKASVIEYGVPKSRCIDASYGWSASRLDAGASIANHSSFTVAFVGTVDVRKGAPLLLEAWARAEIKGTLLLAGAISAEVERRFAAILSRSDVVRLGHIRDVGSVYRATDVFCFPTWEEGGPLVTLEAMAMGVVPVVTPMGTAGAFSATDGVGIVVSSGDVDAIVAALRALANDRSRLVELKRRAKVRASQFSWALVGKRRRDALVIAKNHWQTCLDYG